MTSQQGAFVTSKLVFDQPSVFEFVAQKGLATVLNPAFHHLINALARANPAKYGKYLENFEEIYLVADLIVQFYCLKQFGGSLAENFYGLERVSPNCEERGRKFLKTVHRYCSLFFLVGVPYLKRKIETSFRTWRADLADGKLNSKALKERVKVLLVKIYPWVHFLASLVSLTFLIRYSVGNSKYPSLSLILSRVHLVTAGEESMKEWADKQEIRWKSGLVSIIPSLIALGAKWVLELGAFSLQFAEWWMSSGAAPLSAITALPVPEFPEFEFKEKVCPICRKKQEAPTLLPVSGYVFCYVCIRDQLRNSQECPVTRHKATESSLIQLYADST